jgi:four helix bundle protein
MVAKVKTYKDLRVYNLAFDAAMEIFHATKGFPVEEKYSLVDQMRRSSRSVCANIVEAWRKRRYQKAFILRLNDSESEACETQVWLQFARACDYIDVDMEAELDDRYSHIISQLYLMMNNADKWTL